MDAVAYASFSKKSSSGLVEALRQRFQYTWTCKSEKGAVQLCAQRFVELYGVDDIIYPVHPAVIHLTRYDREHHTDLWKFLYHDLLNDRNPVKTSSELYMHRNTVVNQEKGGKIVCITSQADFIAINKHVGYTMSRAALVGMIKVCALEWAESNMITGEDPVADSGFTIY